MQKSRVRILAQISRRSPKSLLQLKPHVTDRLLFFLDDFRDRFSILAPRLRVIMKAMSFRRATHR